MSAEALTPAPSTARLHLVEADTVPAWARPQRMPRPKPSLALLASETDAVGPEEMALTEGHARVDGGHAVTLMAPAPPPGPAPTSIAAPEAARKHARALAQALSEVLQGVRPAHQLSHWLDLDMLHKMQRRARWELNSSRDMGTERGQTPAHVVACHVQLVGKACECSATIVTRGGARAVCFRLELRRNRWRGVAVEIG